MNSIFEEHGGTYTLGADGMLYPNLILEPKEHRPIGRWGRMHRAYLEAEHPGLYEWLILNGTLNRHLSDAEERARAMLEQLISQMVQQEGITERLKAADEMEWVRQMNSIRSRAEEIENKKSSIPCNTTAPPERQKERIMLTNTSNNAKNPTVVIGIDRGYGNIKTANTCFRAGVTAYEKEPIFTADVLFYNGTYYGIGEDHKEFIPDKMTDQDYYILTLAAIVRELELAHMTSADIHLAVGLPLTWVSEQKDRFRKYLIQRKDVKFSFDGTAYSIRIVGCDVFPQGFAAVADKLAEFKGTTMLCDIGNGTMNIMTISNGKPNPQKFYTEKYGTYQCMLSIREQLMRKFGTAIDDDVIDDALRYGTADIGEKYLTVIQDIARQYVAGIMRRLREHEYNPELMKLYIVGGGGCLIRNFGEYAPNRVTINDDICATAKGYEFLANLRMKKARAA